MSHWAQTSGPRPLPYKAERTHINMWGGNIEILFVPG